MSLEQRLQYFLFDGLAKAFERLGWAFTEQEHGHAFIKKLNDLSEIIVFRKARAFTRAETVEVLSYAEGVTFKDFEGEYIKVYEGNPPLMPL